MIQIYKAIKLAFYNIINCNQRLWLSPRYFAQQVRTLCQVKYLADSACRYCDSWREYALSTTPRPLVTYDDGEIALWIKRLDSREPRNVTYCAESRNFQWACQISREWHSQILHFFLAWEKLTSMASTNVLEWEVLLNKVGSPVDKHVVDKNPCSAEWDFLAPSC